MKVKRFDFDNAKQIGDALGIDWNQFTVEQFQMGLEVELEHGMIDPKTNVTNDDPLLTGKIASAHLNEFPDYYTRLAKMEEEADKFWAKGQGCVEEIYVKKPQPAKRSQPHITHTQVEAHYARRGTGGG